jgi:hypothetical protein
MKAVAMGGNRNFPRSLRGRGRYILAAAALLATCLVGGIPGNTPSAFADTSPIYWGTYISGAPADATKLDAFEASIGRGEAIVHWGEPWVRGGKFQGFPTDLFQRVRDRGSIPMLTWGSWDSSKGTDQPDFRLARISSGAYDAGIKQWAQAAKAWGKPFFLRFDNEMNGDWQFPWAEKINGNRPGEYAQAWRHVHDIFISVGATNTTWVWCPNISGAKTTPMTELYPGDAYVDWTCLDGYNASVVQHQSWQSFSEVFSGGVSNGHRNSYAEITQVAPSKPLMIGETASSEQGGSKADWITSALLGELSHFPAIQAVVWNDWNSGDTRRDWPIDTSQSALSAFAAAVRSDHFVGNSFAHLGASPIPPIGGTTATGAVSPPPPTTPGPDSRLFSPTGFRVDDDAIWGYFQSRGGVGVFGYPVSRTFQFLGCRAQIFQRQVAQVCDDNTPRLLNLLDPDIFPYTAINGSTLPPVDDALKSATPSVADPNYASLVLDYVRANTPDDLDGEPVNFAQTYFGLITSDMANTQDSGTLSLIDLEVWGTPISRPMVDPSNPSFVYQRFQRGVMHYDATTGLTRGLLLGDELKAVLTGQDVPLDLDQQARGSRMYHQYCPGTAGSLCRPGELPATDLTAAFDPG